MEGFVAMGGHTFHDIVGFDNFGQYLESGLSIGVIAI